MAHRQTVRTELRPQARLPLRVGQFKILPVTQGEQGHTRRPEWGKSTGACAAAAIVGDGRLWFSYSNLRKGRQA